MPRSENSCQLPRHFMPAVQFLTISSNVHVPSLPAYMYNRLQSVLNAAVWCVAGLRRSYHITDTLASFHWLKAEERVQLKLATIVYRSLNSTASYYLAADLCRLSDMSSRHLRSSLTEQLNVCQSQCSSSTVEDRAFAVACARLWNSLLPDIVWHAVMISSRKSFLFRQSYLSILF